MKNQLTRNWWVFSLNGLLAVFYAILALFVTEETMVTLAKYSGLAILLVGAVMLLLSIYRIRKDYPFGVLITQSIITIVLGGLILIYTQKTIGFFIMMLGFWAILLGILLLVILVNVGNQFHNKNLLLVNALVSLLFGAIMLLNPYESAKALIALSGVLSLGFGIILIWFSFQLKSLGKAPDLVE
jgi:uncharacterized membrane protein HdeD (DUF308 family)